MLARRWSTWRSAFRSARPSPSRSGVENVLNTCPDVNQYGAAMVGNQYGQFFPFGFNGAYYTRLNVGWGGQ